MKYRLLILLICMICMAAVIPPMAADNYMGGDIVVGGAGPYTLKVTEVQTTVTQGAVAAMPPTILPTTGTLSVTTTPAGATIFIDGVQRGVSPATVPGLAPGSHTLVLMMNGYNDLTATVTITAGQTATYTTDLPLSASSQLPALPASKKTPGFEAAFCIIAAGALLFLREIRSR
jgi:PEGA domain